MATTKARAPCTSMPCGRKGTHRCYDCSAWVCPDHMTHIRRFAAPPIVDLGVCPACFQRRLGVPESPAAPSCGFDHA